MLAMNRYKKWLMTFGIISMIILFLWIACTQKNPIDPTSSLRENVPTLVNISASISQIAIGGSQVEIRVQLVDKNGISMPDEVIQFSTTLGTITPQDSTDSQGWAVVTLVSGDIAGTATVTAQYGQDTALTLTVRFIAAANPFFSLEIQPGILLANGIDYSTITATVLSDSATPMAGIEVEFESDIGTLSETNQITNGDGEAEVTLTSSASYSDIYGTVFATYDTMESAKPVAFLGVFLTLGADPDEILADGESASKITALLKETTTQIAVSDGEVTFSTDRGLIPNSAWTDSRGLAEVDLTSTAGDTGIARIIGRYGATISDTVAVHFTNETPGSFTLTEINASPSSILANGIDQSTITAMVVDNLLNPVNGVVVIFSSTLGAITSQALTDAQGIASVQLTSVASDIDLSTWVRIQMGTQSDSLQVFFSGVQMQAGADPTEILADGISTSTITVILKRTTSQVAISGGVLSLGTDLGLIPNQATTNSSGVAQVSLTSSAGVTGTAHVTVEYGASILDTVDVLFSLVAPSVNTLESIKASPTVLFANGADQTDVSAKVVDDNSDPVEGAVVLFSSTAGTLPVQGITNEVGLASVTMTSDTSSTDVTAWVRAQLGTQADSVSVLFLGIESQVMAFPTSITADGVSTSNIQVVLKQATNKVAISGASLSFGTDQGTIPASAVTNSAGLAQLDLTSGNTPGTAHVEVRYGNMVLDTAEVVFVASVVTNLDVSAMPLTIPADGQSQSIITAVVSDANSIPVNGANVEFENVLLQGTNKGTLSPPSDLTNGNGVATSTLTSGTSPGQVRVYVRTSGLEDSVDVDFRVGDVDHINVVSDSTVLPADGITQTQITATVLDANDNPIENVIVTFGASIGDITPSGTTNASGVVTAQFSSGVVGYATITASSGGITGETVVRLIPGPPNSIVLSFNPTSIGVMGTGQNQTAHVIAEVRDSKNNSVLDSTMVTYSIVHGPGGGEKLSSNDPIPTVGGIARVSLSAGTISGNVRVRAEVDGSLGSILAEASDILIHAGPAYMEDPTNYVTTHLTVRAEKYNIWRSLGTTELEIAVFDKYHNPVQEGTAVYLTASGGGVSTHTALTNEFGKADVILTGANPQPLIHKYYYGELMADPNNTSIVLPGPVYYASLDEWLLPDFELGLITNSMDDSISTCPRYGGADPLYVNLENDGVARIIAYTEGKDAAGDSIRVWDQISVVYSGPVSYNDDSDVTLLGDTLHIGGWSTVTFSLMDGNGNPIESNSVIKASIVPEDAPAAVSWTEINTGSGWGMVYYSITISNAIDFDDPKPGVATIKIEWDAEHQFGTASTYPVFMDI